MPRVNQGPLKLEPIPKRRLAQAVADQLMEAIQELAPGTRVPSERELTSQLGVARTTIREALQGLAMMGIVEIRHGEGVFVVQRPSTTTAETITDLLTRGVTRDFMEARMVVEVEVARLAAQRRTQADLREIAAMLRLQNQTSDLRLAAEYACSFHNEIAEASGNEFLTGFERIFVEVMIERSAYLYETVKDLRKWDSEQHAGLLEAIENQDPELASQRMREHIIAVEHYEAIEHTA